LFDAEEIKKEYSNGELKKIKDHGIWPIKIDNRLFILYPTEKIITVPSYILDLCSLDRNGIANINFDVSIVSKYKSYHSARYFSGYKDKFFGKEFIDNGESIVSRYEKLFEELYSQVRSEIACNSQCVY